MDYDKSDIAAIYDEARVLTPAGLRQWLDLLSTHTDRNTISLVVDLGCGTGRFSEPLATHFGARVIAIDPSQKMLDQARRKLATAGVVLQRALGQVQHRQGRGLALLRIMLIEQSSNVAGGVDGQRTCCRLLRRT